MRCPTGHFFFILFFGLFLLHVVGPPYFYVRSTKICAKLPLATSTFRVLKTRWTIFDFWPFGLRLLKIAPEGCSFDAPFFSSKIRCLVRFLRVIFCHLNGPPSLRLLYGVARWKMRCPTTPKNSHFGHFFAIVGRASMFLCRTRWDAGMVSHFCVKNAMPKHIIGADFGTNLNRWASQFWDYPPCVVFRS